jgi:hypothetical protein
MDGSLFLSSGTSTLPVAGGTGAYAGATAMLYFGLLASVSRVLPRHRVGTSDHLRLPFPAFPGALIPCKS